MCQGDECPALGAPQPRAGNQRETYVVPSTFQERVGQQLCWPLSGVRGIVTTGDFVQAWLDLSHDPDALDRACRADGTARAK